MVSANREWLVIPVNCCRTGTLRCRNAVKLEQSKNKIGLHQDRARGDPGTTKVYDSGRK